MDELFSALDIKLPLSAQDLQKLIDWCEHTISTDLQSEGDLQTRAAFYQGLASLFLNEIQPHMLLDDLTAPVASFEGMSSLQHIVNHGFDVYLKTIHPTPEQINVAHNGISLLAYAVAAGHVHTTEALLSLGADPKEKATGGASYLLRVLMLPIAYDEKMPKNKQAIYRLLSPFYPDLLAEKDSYGDTVLHKMALHGYTQLIEEILSKPETIELAFISNNFVHYPIHTAILNAQPDSLRLLIQVKGAGDIKDAKKRGPLHYAALYGNHEMVDHCLPYCDKNAVDIYSRTPLICASIANNLQSLQALLASGVEVNEVDYEGRSALHYAVESNNLEAVTQLLTQDSIQVNIGDLHSHNPLDLVTEHTPDADKMSQLLIKHGAHLFSSAKPRA